VVTTVLAAIGAAVALLFFGPPLSLLYWQHVGGKDLRQRLGFELGVRPTSLPGRPEMYVVTEVRPGGPFDHAGIQPGDTLKHWVGYGPELGSFYEWLQSASGKSITLELVNVRYGPHWFEHVREVRVEVPAEARTAQRRSLKSSLLRLTACCSGLACARRWARYR